MNIVRDISPHDEMFQGDESHYLGVGQSAVECIGCSLRAAQLSAVDVKDILDLPCGYGRVLRYLRVAFPAAEITACDLLRDGVDYCATVFGARPVYSDTNPAKIPIDCEAFDLIWVGSLFTHLHSDRWFDFLEFFRRSLRPGAVLVFSTHGWKAYDMIVRGVVDYGLPYWRITAVRYGYERTGFGYAEYLKSNSYGISLSSPVWVLKQIAAIPEFRLVYLSESAWDANQDIYACVRDPDWKVHHPPTSALSFLKHKLRERVKPR